MGRELFLVVSLLALAPHAKVFQTIPPSTQVNFLSQQIRMERPSLLAVSAEGFDFRDEHNHPTAGNQPQADALFLESAWNLLVLGQTWPRVYAGKLLSAAGDLIKRLVLSVEKAKTLTLSAINSWRSVARRSAVGRMVGRILNRSFSLSLTHRLLFRIFLSQNIPLRL
ncbi:MAG: hypothetical protein HYT79_03025 [Elusimicrobia bacterium]|nr:hypothetical protein [Elusimicrobiota bacterium]